MTDYVKGILKLGKTNFADLTHGHYKASSLFYFIIFFLFGYLYSDMDGESFVLLMFRNGMTVCVV